MEAVFSLYRKFISKADALELIEILKENNIDFLLEDNSMRVDSSFGSSDNNSEFLLKIDKNNFEKVEKLEEDLIKDSLEKIDKDYYLFEYSDEELTDVLVKKEEWSKFDYLLAQKILKERGKEINPDLINSINKRRIEDLSKQEESPNFLIYTGYLFAFLGGFIGIFIGLYLMKYKKNLPNGDSIYGFKIEDRKSGQNILIISIIAMFFWAIVRYMK